MTQLSLQEAWDNQQKINSALVDELKILKEKVKLLEGKPKLLNQTSGGLD